jgi:hypothetical protein
MFIPFVIYQIFPLLHDVLAPSDIMCADALVITIWEMGVGIVDTYLAGDHLPN